MYLFTLLEIGCTEDNSFLLLPINYSVHSSGGELCCRSKDLNLADDHISSTGHMAHFAFQFLKGSYFQQKSTLKECKIVKSSTENEKCLN